jgi:hypothetical protein
MSTSAKDPTVANFPIRKSPGDQPQPSELLPDSVSADIPLLGEPAVSRQNDAAKAAAATVRELERHEQGWAARRAQMHTLQKQSMAKYYVEHDFLVIDSPASPRDTVASILVNQGTTPNVVVQEALAWMTRYWKQFGPFDVTWYTTSGLVMTTLRDFRVSNFEQAIAAQIFLFPGRVNGDMQAVSGPAAENFVNQLDVDFTYAFLSVYAFDLESGRTRFQYEEEVPLQSACARLYAAHKLLFVDSSKFRRDGTPGYTLSDLLKASKTVTIYTTSSTPEHDKVIKDRCVELAERLLPTTAAASPSTHRTLRLRIVTPDNSHAESWQHEGYLAQG